ncbi:uncharacterized protein EV422DRAFT_579479 [Fimicolochytrium jonesii]|uniref:uncharacterized protein n=1 Tax=Fimicolochytrium jonesii TaxID=1396493 RepID=UPI0022FEC0B3|nr:uncharacterized protein EV422DRAFT_579479 [Fimicolochytrium jonesii]KAI8819444.1 hypothetical protein EV422DRAFT_579479 [Fimicolochytrium jonesii]
MVLAVVTMKTWKDMLKKWNQGFVYWVTAVLIPILPTFFEAPYSRFLSLILGTNCLACGAKAQVFHVPLGSTLIYWALNEPITLELWLDVMRVRVDNDVNERTGRPPRFSRTLFAEVKQHRRFHSDAMWRLLDTGDRLAADNDENIYKAGLGTVKSTLRLAQYWQ